MELKKVQLKWKVCYRGSTADLRKQKREFPGGPVVRTPCFHCWGPGFNPWSGTKIPQAAWCGPKKKSRRKKSANLKIGHLRLSSLETGRKKKNEEKWAEPRRTVEQHQHTNVHTVRVPEGVERKEQKERLKEQWLKTPQICRKTMIYVSK